MRCIQPSSWTTGLVVFALTTSAAWSQETYDVIVVGSGPGGLAAAEYLSRDPDVSVLILEAGLPSLKASGGTDVPSYARSQGWTKFDIPGEYDKLIYNPEMEKYRVNWISGPFMWLGKLVGGCSSINAQLYFRTPDSYITGTKWPFSPEHVNALFDENERIYASTDRPSPDQKLYTQDSYEIVADAFRRVGYSERMINDPVARNSKSKTFGHAPFTFRNGMRDSPAATFLGRMNSRPNVKLVTSAMVNYVKHWKGQATGVVYNNNIEVGLSGRGAVVMAAGAMSTPKVLIQSGIGPQDQLNMLNGRSDFPGVRQSAGGWVTNENVGKHLFDTNVVFASFSHPQMTSFRYRDQPAWAIQQYMSQGQTGPWASAGPVLIGYENYEVNGRFYEFQTTVLTNGFGSHASNPKAFATALYVNNPESRDYSSFQPDGSWKGFSRGSLYMSTPNDLAAMQNYATRVVEAMRAQGATFLDAANGQSVADWVSNNRGYITHHFGGSCYTSSDSNDRNRCADEKFRVIGTKNVFVADASLQRDGTVNPYGFIMYIGREAGGLVKAHLSSSPPVPTPSPPPSTCTIEAGVDYVGNDVGSAYSANAEGCCAICEARSSCKAFSWTNYNGGTCWLKSGKGATKSDPTVRSGTVGSAPPPPTPTPTPTPSPPPPSSCTTEYDVDYAGNDVGNVHSANYESCCSICKNHRECGAYTWTNYNGGTCWLKSRKGSSQYKAGARSGVVDESPPPAPCSPIEENTDYLGGDIGNAPSSNAENCCAICRSRAGCGAYSWSNYNGGTCWLKSSKGATQFKSGVRSAVVNRTT